LDSACGQAIAAASAAILDSFASERRRAGSWGTRRNWPWRHGAQPAARARSAWRRAWPFAPRPNS